MIIRKCFDYVVSSKLRIIIFLFVFSFIIRIGFLIPLTISKVPMLYDEITFMNRAIGFENVFTKLSNFQLPSSDDLVRAYGAGKQPPLSGLLPGAGLFLFGRETAAARFSMLIISAMTTPIVYLLTLRLSTQKAAIIAAFLHIFYPSFIGYSHYVYSETPYIFFLLLAVYFTFLVSDAQIRRKRVLNAVLSGLFLGLTGLTRAAVLPFLFLVPFWIVLSMKEKMDKIVLPAIVILSWLIVLSPWQAVLLLKDKNPGILSTITGWYLHIGNNPWVPKGYGSSWFQDSRGLMLEAAKEYNKKHPIGIDKAQRVLALQEIKRDFKAFLIRGIYKLRMLWSCDYFVLQYLFHTAYPPIHPAVAALIWIVILISYITILVLAISGFLIRDSQFLKRGLILLMVTAGMAQSAVTFGISRFHQPLLALLLPIAGFGAANLKQKISFIRRTAIILVALLFCVSIFTSLPLVISSYVRPSSHYCELISRVDNLLGSDTTCFDRVILRADHSSTSDRLSVVTHSDGYKFNLIQQDIWIRVPQTREYDWEISPENKILTLDIYAHNTSVPLEILLASERHEQTVIIQPIRKRSWRQWQPTGIDGIDYMWLGGGIGTRRRLPEEELTRFDFP